MAKKNSRRRDGRQPRKPVHEVRHRPVWRRQDCSACAQPVIMAEERLDNGRLRGAILDAQPDPAGVLVRGDDGYVTRNNNRTEGKRWRWHNCPVRNTPQGGEQ